MYTVTCIAPVNIAVLKYWGKKDEELILPVNDSISATLDTDHLFTKTTVMTSENFKEDRMWLNGQEENMENCRLQRCLTEIRKRAKHSKHLQWKIHICSENNFPTGAGLASSAAGYACLVLALAKLYEIKGELSSIARIGSGSACRSVIGGFVKWSMGSLPDGSDSIAKQIVPASHWPEMRVIILVLDDTRKKVPSSIGMRRSMETSDMLKLRINYVVSDRAKRIERAIIEKDFETFAICTMKDSNQLHAICMDTYPPLFYMNEESRAIVDLVHTYNETVKKVQVAYTFDAGPNAVLYLLEENVPEFLGVLLYAYPEIGKIEYCKGLPRDNILISQELNKAMNIKPHEISPPVRIKCMIHTKLGDGPKYIIQPENHLLNQKGLPINHV
ncbi:PREDICTED: diphosphomevalonate decarboxylase [Eufriesea mexicana]|uniref:diphosphomevalonate decarboxylase n=1 Tax=Eufriesea mexicana TaxID=516756 RepID=UPI00083C12F7|nr:PREDICTED: diphosphomevalonate decarboxylase [Eufriesea mexicana]